MDSQMILQSHDWSHDIFSLGVIFLELVLGWPVWMNMQCRVTSVLKPDLEIITTGIFSVNCRDKAKIKAKQLKVIENLDFLLENAMGFSNLGKDGENLLKHMLKIDSRERISPQDALRHKFLN